MKSIHFVLAVACFAQVCLTAPTGDASNELDDYLTDAKIDDIRYRLYEAPGLSLTAVDNFVDILRKFRKDTPEKEKIEGVMNLLALALQRCGDEKLDLSKLLESSSSESEESESVDGLTDADMREAQDELAKLMSAEQVQHAMIILNGFRVGATKEQNFAAVVDLVSSAMHTLRTECGENSVTQRTFKRVYIS